MLSHSGGGGRGGPVNDPSAAPSLSAETARQATTADQSDDRDEDGDGDHGPVLRCLCVAIAGEDEVIIGNCKNCKNCKNCGIVEWCNNRIVDW